MYLLFFISFCLVGFGQPAWSPICAVVASFCGYALFFKPLLGISQGQLRFWIGTLWFTCVQLLQLSWMISHPFLYIYLVYFLLALAMGIQFGLLSMLMRFSYLNIPCLMGMTGFWVIMEWSRLFFLSGFSFNPIGLALTANFYSMQWASLAGIYGLSFWVMFVNLLGLKTFQHVKWLPFWAMMALTPYLFGLFQVEKHEKNMEASSEVYHAVLVQTAFPTEETLALKGAKEWIAYSLGEWRQILKITKKQLGQSIDLMVLPEVVVPMGTYSFVYPYSVVEEAFKLILGPETLARLPPLESPLASEIKVKEHPTWMVNNAYWAQALSQIFQCEVVIGLEDAESIGNEREYYSSALHITPMGDENPQYRSFRYEKRVLVPMGEYIPLPLLAKLAERYGIYGSFTPGKEAKVSPGKKRLGLSICYEETYADLMRENKQKGADILINLTSDIWYPNSRLIYQHFDHARLRTVENGIPLLRACNTGVTAGLDSTGRVIGQLGKGNPEVETLSDSLFVSIPTYTYSTLYASVGDSLIVGLSLFMIVIGCFNACRK